MPSCPVACGRDQLFSCSRTIIATQGPPEEAGHTNDSWRLQLTEFCRQSGVVGHPLADHPDHSAAVDQVSGASVAVLCADRAVVGDQGKA